MSPDTRSLAVAVRLLTGCSPSVVTVEHQPRSRGGRERAARVAAPARCSSAVTLRQALPRALRSMPRALTLAASHAQAERRRNTEVEHWRALHTPPPTPPPAPPPTPTSPSALRWPADARLQHSQSRDSSTHSQSQPGVAASPMGAQRAAADGWREATAAGGSGSVMAAEAAAAGRGFGGCVSIYRVE